MGRSEYTYNILVNGFVKQEKMEKALEVQGMMKEEGIRPNTVNYNILMRGFVKRGEMERAMELLEEMEPTYFGGSMISEAHLTGAKWAEPPAKFADPSDRPTTTPFRVAARSRGCHELRVHGRAGLVQRLAAWRGIEDRWGGIAVGSHLFLHPLDATTLYSRLHNNTAEAWRPKSATTGHCG